MSKKSYAADITSIKEANERIKPFIHTTPVLSSEALNAMANKKLLFKCECFQKGGAFKFRGALNAVLSLDDQQASKGVVTHSRPVVRDLVDDIVLVDDDEIIDAMKYCYEILKIVVEPSGAIGLAAVLSESFRNNPRWTNCNNIAIVISGGNIDLGVLWNRFRNV